MYVQLLHQYNQVTYQKNNIEPTMIETELQIT